MVDFAREEVVTRDLVLICVDRNTGEIVNRDGSIGGKVVPIEPTKDMVDDGNLAQANVRKTKEPEDHWINECYYTFKAMSAASYVDLTGAVIELPKTDARSCEYGEGYDQCIVEIKAQMPKEKK